MTYRKPAPLSMYKHLCMLANFCQEKAETVESEELKAAFATTWRKLQTLANSRAVALMLERGE